MSKPSKPIMLTTNRETGLQNQDSGGQASTHVLLHRNVRARAEARPPGRRGGARGSRGWALAALVMLVTPLEAQTLVNVDFGVGTASLRAGMAAAGMGTNDYWNLYRHYDPKFTPGMPLVANGKHYVIYWLNSGLTVLNAIVFWLALRGGIGIYSSFIASFAQLLLSAAWLWRLSSPFRTVGGVRGAFDSGIFKEVVAFARDSMLWQIGGQTLGVLPIVLASAWFALGATADISAGMKLVILMISVCTRFGDMSVTPLSIQFAQGNEAAAAIQMARIARVAGAISACAALLIVCVNPAFIGWWMLDKINWSWHENMAGALWVAILSVTQCMYGYAMICRQMGIIRWALLSECLLYIALAYGFRGWAGPACLLWAKPVATLINCIIVAWRIKQHTLFDTRQLMPVVLRQAVVLLLLIPPCLYFSHWIATVASQPFLALVFSGMLSLVAMLLATPLWFTREMRADLYRILRDLLEKFRRSKAEPPAAAF